MKEDSKRPSRAPAAASSLRISHTVLRRHEQPSLAHWDRGAEDDTSGDEMTADRPCPRCSRSCPYDQRFCAACGASLRPEEEIIDDGTIIDRRYRLMAKLGEGGMGAVYRVEHVRMGKAMALKLLRPDLTRDRKAVERFRREAQTMSKLDHPNVIAVFDSGETQTGLLYLVMEYVPGKDLAATLREEGRLEIRRALEITVQVLKGLRAAHEAGIVHRDVKPGNVMLAKGHGGLKILDFGIAKLIEGQREGLGRITAGADIVGTPSCMSPEQARGERLDPRSDLYSVTSMLYELIAGRGPFIGTPLEVVGMHLMKNPPSLKSVAPSVDLPPDVEAILAKGLQKDPDDRFQSAAEMQHAIEAALGSKMSSISTPESFPIARREDWDAFEHSLKRQMIGTRIAAVFGIAAVVGAGFLIEDRLGKRRSLEPVAIEHEPNDAPVNANVIAPGTPVRGHIGVRRTSGVSDRDLFELNVRQESVASFWVSAVPNVNVVIELYGTNAADGAHPQQIAISDDGPVSEGEELTDLLLAPGQYFVRLSERRRLDELDGAPRENSTDAYRLLVDLQPPKPDQEIEPNNTPKTATPALIDKPLLGRAGRPGIRAFVRGGPEPPPTWAADLYRPEALAGVRSCAVVATLPYSTMRLTALSLKDTKPKKPNAAAAKDGKAISVCGKPSEEVLFEVRVDEGNTGDAMYPIAFFNDAPGGMRGVVKMAEKLQAIGRPGDARQILEKALAQLPKNDETTAIEALLASITP